MADPALDPDATPGEEDPGLGEGGPPDGGPPEDEGADAPLDDAGPDVGDEGGADPAVPEEAPPEPAAAPPAPAAPAGPPPPDPAAEARKAREEEEARRAKEAEEAQRAKEAEEAKRREERAMGIEERRLRDQEELRKMLAQAEEDALKEQDRLEELLKEEALYEEITRDLHRLKKAHLRLERIRKDDKVDNLKAEIAELHDKFHEVQLEEDLDDFDVKDLKKEIAKLQEENARLIQKAEDVKIHELREEFNQLQKVNSQLHETILKDRSSQLQLQKAVTYKYLSRMHKIKCKKDADIVGEEEKPKFEGPSDDMAEMDRRRYTDELQDLYADYKQMYKRMSRGKNKMRAAGDLSEEKNAAIAAMQDQAREQFKMPVRAQTHQQRTGEKIEYCHNYQVGRCAEDVDHFTTVKGEPRFYRHMCSRCYTQLGDISRHPALSPSCPAKKAGGLGSEAGSLAGGRRRANSGGGGSSRGHKATSRRDKSTRY